MAQHGTSVDLRQSPAPDSLKAQMRRMTPYAPSDNVNVKPLPVAPRVFDVPVASTEDMTGRHYVSCMVATHKDQLVMFDGAQKLLKVVPLSDPDTLRAERLSKQHTLRPITERDPVAMAALANGQVVMTTWSPFLLFLSLDGDYHQWQVETSQDYIGVLEGPDHTLIVSSWYKKNFRNPDAFGLSSVDIIRHDGTLVRTVLRETDIPKSVPMLPVGLADNLLLFSNLGHTVFKVDITQAQLHGVYQLPKGFNCIKAAQNQQESVFFVDDSKNHVLVRSPQGEFVQILDGGQSTRNHDIYAFNFCLTRAGLVVAWINGEEDHPHNGACTVIGYEWL